MKIEIEIVVTLTDDAGKVTTERATVCEKMVIRSSELTALAVREVRKRAILRSRGQAGDMDRGLLGHD